MNSKRPRLDENNNISPLINSESLDDQISTDELGIQYFLQSSVAGFDCVLKNRWEDFLVREIRSGSCARLTDIKPIINTESDISTKDAKSVLNMYLDELNQLEYGKLQSVQINAPDLKTERTKIHQAIRLLFPSFQSSTIKNEANNTIEVVKLKKNQRNYRKKTNLTKKFPYTQFVLYKEGKDTISAIQILSRLLHINPGAFSYAGTKDRRAITTQYVTVKRVDSETLATLNNRLQGMRVGNFNYVSTPIFLGDLDGNQFVVVLRSVSASEVEVVHAINNWKQNGFINYYGTQRFGHSSSCKSFEVGKCLIRCDWINAIKLILTPTSADLPILRQIKQDYLESDDANSCGSKSPVSLEKSLLLGIAKNGKTLNALQMLPRNLRQLYIHSYQAYIWNHIASRRMKQQSPSDPYAEPGDLYFDETNSINSSDCEPVIHPQVVEANSKIPLTSVVLPLPGYSVKFPVNESAEWYTEMLNADDIKMTDFKHRVKDFAMPGSYRFLIVKPENINYEFKSYYDYQKPLIKTDLQLLEPFEERADDPVEKGMENMDIEKLELALVLTFNLPKSSYATIAIRELTKKCVEKK